MKYVESIIIHNDDLSIKVGEWYQGVYAIVLPHDATCPNLEFTSSNTDVATVKVDYSLTTGSETVVLDDELLCIKMDEKWYVLKDGAFTN